MDVNADDGHFLCHDSWSNSDTLKTLIKFVPSMSSLAEAFIYAASLSNFERVALLLEADVPVDMEHPSNLISTALTQSLISNPGGDRMRCVALLVSAGANLNYVDIRGYPYAGDWFLHIGDQDGIRTPAKL